MPYIPHTDSDITEMLQSLKLNRVEDLFDEIPAFLKNANFDDMPTQLAELDVQKLMQKKAYQDSYQLNFIGAGAYEHYIPASVWELASRGEWLTAYTPYQAEASQGTLQLLYEYQSMMANLLLMDVANSSLYEGASALAEAVLMAVRLADKPQKKVLVPLSIHPAYRRVLKTLISAQGIEIIELPFDTLKGRMVVESLKAWDQEDISALLIPQPNFFGILEDTDGLTDWAYVQGVVAIGLVNPLAMALLQPPGVWGKHGVDIACGEGQPLGIPLASGGPYCGFIACKKIHIRQLPGRLIGRTLDTEGREGFTLTLQAREQHIRRAKATSNICTNQGLLVVATSIYLSLMGSLGLKTAAAFSHTRAVQLMDKLQKSKLASRVFSGSFFHEIVMKFHQPIQEILAQAIGAGILIGYSLEHEYPELKNCLLICTTETKTEQDLDELIAVLSKTWKS